MAVMLGSKLGKEIADLLGLKHTRTIKITIPYNDFVIVEVEYLLDDAEGQLTGLMQTKRFRLELVDEDEPINLFEPLSDTVEIADVTPHQEPNAKGELYRQHITRVRP